MIWIALASLPLAVLAAIGLLATRSLSRASRRRRAWERDASRHRETLDRSGRWIREGRMRAVLSSPGAKSWYLAVAAHHLQLATEAEAAAGTTDSAEFSFLAEQHRLMHHLFITAPMQSAAASQGGGRVGLRA
jgi:hypothetical protein